MALDSIHDLGDLLTPEQQGRMDADYLRRIAREIGIVFSIDKATVREAILALINEPRKKQIMIGLETLKAEA